MAGKTELEASRVLRNRWMLALGATPLLLYVPLVAYGLSGHGGPAILLALHPLFLTLVWLFAIAKKNPRARLAQGVVRVEEHTVTMPDGEVVQRSKLRQGFVRKKADGAAFVTLFGPRVPIELSVASEAVGRELLAALELDATQQAASFLGQSRLATKAATTRVLGAAALWLPATALLLASLLVLPHRGAGSSAGMIGLGLLFAGIASMLLPLVVYAVAARPTRISVGVDGVETLWLGRRRFVPFSRVERVEMLTPDLGAKVSRGVALVLDDGTRELLPLSLTSLVEGEAERLAARIEQALAARRSTAVPPAALLSSVDDARARVALLLRIGSGANAGPRSGATSPEALANVLEDAGAPAAARASAAIALATEGDPERREQILRAARQVASPRLRFALECAASPDSDEAALVEALASVAEEERAGARGQRRS